MDDSIYKRLLETSAELNKKLNELDMEMLNVRNHLHVVKSEFKKVETLVLLDRVIALNPDTKANTGSLTPFGFNSDVTQAEMVICALATPMDEDSQLGNSELGMTVSQVRECISFSFHKFFQIESISSTLRRLKQQGRVINNGPYWWIDPNQIANYAKYKQEQTAKRDAKRAETKKANEAKRYLKDKKNADV